MDLHSSVTGQRSYSHTEARGCVDSVGLWWFLISFLTCPGKHIKPGKRVKRGTSRQLKSGEAKKLRSVIEMETMLPSCTFQRGTWAVSLRPTAYSPQPLLIPPFGEGSTTFFPFANIAFSFGVISKSVRSVTGETAEITEKGTVAARLIPCKSAYSAVLKLCHLKAAVTAREDTRLPERERCHKP